MHGRVGWYGMCMMQVPYHILYIIYRMAWYDICIQGMVCIWACIYHASVYIYVYVLPFGNLMFPYGNQGIVNHINNLRRKTITGCQFII